VSWIYVEPDPEPDALLDALRQISMAGAEAARGMREVAKAWNVTAASMAAFEPPGVSGDQLRRSGPGFEIRMPGMDLDEAGEPDHA
jgi:hypothetical protein